ncbi:hypothetical protein [Neoaquamicrobium sediminum]|uniref:hypothetical protein n=1 Tax=Neoaquamicrobium sediminum TaxID=1849104 RepID=UPI001564CC6F|nr:hypothetical protein [Mesorhizobium sediminum]NRC56166.1 hypothetical protein [Mesorhizobium sediminum]
MSMTKTGAILLMALGILAPGSKAAPVAPDMDAITGSISARSEVRFRLHAGGVDDTCVLIAAEVPDLEDRRPLRFGAQCPDLGGNLNAARWWQDREDGSIAFTKDDGGVVAEFAVADGAAFVSYAPRQPIMTLLAVD